MSADFSAILKAFCVGDPVIVFDFARENEGDFFFLADKISDEKVNFLLSRARGQICVAAAPEILERLEIPLLPHKNTAWHPTNFAMPVDAADQITTGISAPDRARTIQILADPKSKPADLVQPGHTSVLLAKDPRTRFGHTEAAVELCKNGRQFPAAVICEILDDDGQKASAKFLANSFPHIPSISLEHLRQNLLKK